MTAALVLVYRPLTTSNMSTPVLFRSIEGWQPTSRVDEVDSFLRDNDEAHGILNGARTLIRRERPDRGDVIVTAQNPMANITCVVVAKRQGHRHVRQSVIATQCLLVG